MKPILIAAAVAVAAVMTMPALAQSYTAGQGTGNLVDAPLAEKTNGACGFGGNVAPPAGDSQAAYHSRQSSAASASVYAPNSAQKAGRGRTWRSDTPER